MRSLIISIIVLTLTFSTSYWYVQTSHICPVPIYYRLGDIDERFNINEEEALEVLSKAEAVWEDSIGRDLYVYDNEASFAVNFIYDERQQLASTEEEWRNQLDIQQVESRTVIDKVKDVAAAYKVLQDAYDAKRVVYDERLAVYNAKVEDINNDGGASAPVFAELQKEKKELSALLAELISQEKQLNVQADDINNLGDRGNALIEQYNAEVLKYNEVYGDLDLYTQGDFQRDIINIYKFSNLIELEKVIVHEFGHSLGIGHVEGGRSMMYYLMAEQPDDVVLSEEDKQAFVTICGDGTGFEYEARRIIRTVLSKINKLTSHE